MELFNKLHELNNLADGCGIHLVLTDNDDHRNKVGYHHRGNSSAGVERAIEDAANRGFDVVWVHYRD